MNIISLLNALWVAWGFLAFMSITGVLFLATIWAVTHFVDRLLWKPWYFSMWDFFLVFGAIVLDYTVIASYLNGQPL